MPKSKFKFWTFIMVVIATASVVYLNRNSKEEDIFPLAIDLSNISGISNLKFIVPKENNPTYYGENYFKFYVGFEKSPLGSKKIGPATTNDLNIIVQVQKENKHLRSVYSTRNAIVKSNLIGERSGFKIYEEYIGQYGDTKLTHYIKTDINGFPVIITQPGDLNLRAYRAISDNIELDYVFSSQLGIENWDELDDYIMKTVESFMEPPNKSLKDAP